MSVTLILLNYNDYETTSKYLDIVKKYNSIMNIVVVDNCSNNESYERLKFYESEKVSVIKTNKNGGYAYGNNFGIRFAEEKFNPEYIIISNPDVYFNEEIIKEMKKKLEKNNNIGLVAPKIINNKNSTQESAWKLPDYWDNICSLSIVLSKIFRNKIYYNKSHYNEDVSYVDVVVGCFFMAKRSVLSEVGYFDESTFLYGEENILAFKLKIKGYKNIILNKYSYYHEHSASINKTYKSNIDKYNILYNSLEYYNKKYLKTRKVKNLFFRYLWKISIVEKKILNIVRSK